MGQSLARSAGERGRQAVVPHGRSMQDAMWDVPGHERELLGSLGLTMRDSCGTAGRGGRKDRSGLMDRTRELVSQAGWLPSVRQPAGAWARATLGRAAALEQVVLLGPRQPA